MTTVAARVAAAEQGGEGAQMAMMGRFHVAAVAFQRARQLQNNAAPRVETDGHKLHRIALMEVLAGAISWSVKEKELGA